MKKFNDAAQQFVGRERRERVSQLVWCGAGCFDSRRRVNSTVRAHRSLKDRQTSARLVAIVRRAAFCIWPGDADR